MPISPLLAALNQLAEEKGLSREVVLETLETALAAAYRREYGHPEEQIRVEFDPETEEMKVWQIFDVVKEVENPHREIRLSEARKLKKKVKLGQTLEKALEAKRDFGRIAAQTAKQVILQRLKEAERDILISEYRAKVGQVITGTVQQIEGGNVIVNLGRVNGILFPGDQIPGEHYAPGQRLRVWLDRVEERPRGPLLAISRSHPSLVVGLFGLEVPEISQGSVAIVGIAREAGVRTKIAVAARQEAVDPVGSCVGQRGARINAVLAELPNEKIDIIEYSEDPEVFIRNALSPAKVDRITIKKRVKKAQVFVPEDQLSLAIGKRGQNVRLASKLTGYELDIRSAEGKKVTVEEQPAEVKEIARGEQAEAPAVSQPSQAP